MKLFMSLLISIMLVPMFALGSLSNENNAHIMLINMGSAAVDLVQLTGLNPGKRIEIISVHLLNGASIAASDTDFIQMSIEKGPIGGTTVVAEIDSRAAHENGITANIAEPMNLVAAEVIVAKNLLLSVNHNETDAGTNVALTNAMVVINYIVR